MEGISTLLSKLKCKGIFIDKPLYSININFDKQNEFRDLDCYDDCNCENNCDCNCFNDCNCFLDCNCESNDCYD